MGIGRQLARHESNISGLIEVQGGSEGGLPVGLQDILANHRAPQEREATLCLLTEILGVAWDRRGSGLGTISPFLSAVIFFLCSTCSRMWESWNENQHLQVRGETPDMLECHLAGLQIIPEELQEEPGAHKSGRPCSDCWADNRALRDPVPDGPSHREDIVTLDTMRSVGQMRFKPVEQHPAQEALRIKPVWVYLLPPPLCGCIQGGGRADDSVVHAHNLLLLCWCYLLLDLVIYQYTGLPAFILYTLSFNLWPYVQEQWQGPMNIIICKGGLLWTTGSQFQWEKKQMHLFNQ